MDHVEVRIRLPASPPDGMMWIAVGPAGEVKPLGRAMSTDPHGDPLQELAPAVRADFGDDWRVETVPQQRWLAGQAPRFESGELVFAHTWGEARISRLSEFASDWCRARIYQHFSAEAQLNLVDGSLREAQRNAWRDANVAALDQLRQSLGRLGNDELTNFDPKAWEGWPSFNTVIAGVEAPPSAPAEEAPAPEAPAPVPRTITFRDAPLDLYEADVQQLTGAYIASIGGSPVAVKLASGAELQLRSVDITRILEGWYASPA